jgi:DnaJ-class molecular chaperone
MPSVMIVDCPKCDKKGWYENKMLVPICERCHGQGLINQPVVRRSGREKRLWHMKMQQQATLEFQARQRQKQEERTVVH